MAGNTERRNDNFTPSLTAKSNAGNNNDVILWADPSTHSLLVTASVAISGGSKTNNAAAPTSDNLGVLPAVASVAAPSYTEGYQVLLSTDLSGALRVTGSLSVGGATDNAAFVAGTTTGSIGMGFYHSTIDTLTDGRSGAFALTSKRSQHVTLHTAAGVETGIAAAPLQVSLANTGANATAILVNVASGGIASGAIASGAVASGAFASGSIASGAIAAGAIAAGATSIAENEDVASADGDRGVKILFKRLDSPANSSNLSGDYEQPQMSAGRIWVSATIDAALPAGTNAIGKLAANSGVDIGDVDVTTVGTITPGTAATSLGKAEDAGHTTGDVGVMSLGVANTADANISGTTLDYTPISTDLTGAVRMIGNADHDAADAGKPVKIGAKAIASLKTTTLVSGADRTDAQSDLDGAILMRGQFPLGDLISERVSNTDGASTAFTNFAAVASTKAYITGITVFRTDAATTTAYVDFRDGTAGSVLWSLPLPPNGGAVLPVGAVPYFKTSANTALAFDVSTALTTVYISVTGFYSKL